MSAQPQQNKSIPFQALPENTPRNEENEMIVLGSVLINPDVFDNVAAILHNVDDFWAVKHQHIYAAMRRINERNEEINRVVLRSELDAHGYLEVIGGDVYITELVNSTPSAMYAEQIAVLVAQDAERRTMLKAADDIKTLAFDKTTSLHEIKSKADGIWFEATQNTQDVMNASLDSAINKFNDELNHALSGVKTYQKTHFVSVDMLIKGLFVRELCIIAGLPGTGKTSFLLSLIYNLMVHETGNVLFFSLEMPKNDIIRRFVSMLSAIPVEIIKTGELTAEQVQIIDIVTPMIHGWRNRLFIVDKHDMTDGGNELNMQRVIRRIERQRGKITNVLIDGLWKMTPLPQHARLQEREQYARRTYALTEIAKNFNIGITALHQLNARKIEERAANQRKPRKSDLFGASAIEQDANVILALHRDDAFSDYTGPANPPTELIALKNRDGQEGGGAYLDFIKARGFYYANTLDNHGLMF